MLSRMTHDDTPHLSITYWEPICVFTVLMCSQPSTQWVQIRHAAIVQPVQPQKSLRMKIKYKISILWHQPSIFCLQFVLLPGTDDQICSASNLNSNKINLLINFTYLKVSFSIFSFSPYTDHNTHYWAEKLKSIQSLNSERQTRNTINWKMRLEISDVENLKKKSVDLAEQMHGWLDIVPSISAFFMCRVEMQSVERIIYNEELVQVDCVKQC